MPNVSGESLEGGGGSSISSSGYGIVWSSPTQTWSASGTTVTFTCPSTVNGQTVKKLVIVDVAVRLIAGSPGNSATFGLTIGGNLCFSTRQLPPYGGGVDLTLVNLNVQSLSGTIKAASPGDAIVITSGGTFAQSTQWQIDLLGYYII